MRMVGLQKEEPSWFNKVFGGPNDNQSNFFGKSAEKESWNPLTRSKSAAKWFVFKVIVFLVVLKVSWNFVKSVISYPFRSNQNPVYVQQEAPQMIMPSRE